MQLSVTNAMIITLFLTCAIAISIACGSGPDPAKKAQELAKSYVNENIDGLSENIADLIVGQNRLAREIGGEVIEDMIHEGVSWTYSQPMMVREDIYEVVATAGLNFDAGLSIIKFNVKADLPVNLTVDLDSEQVRHDIDISRASIDISR